VHAALAVAADGAGSVLRARAGIGADIEDYEQVAIVVNAATDRPNRGEAFERFTASGPLAVLPLGNGPLQPAGQGAGGEFKGGYAVVWAVTPERAAELLALDEAAFAARLLDAFGWRAGRWTRIGRRNTYPLTLSRARDTVAGRVVLIGNAAQALHPVAGQGFNLGLRDAATLAEMLAQTQSAAADERDLDGLLARFSTWRDEDRSGVTRFTDGLVKLFGSDRPGVSTIRNFGLLLFDLSPAAKRALSRVSWGFAGRMPRLARGLPLE
jgi:2-octaprenyl-6-methoxyphenol hydroxylase